MLECLSIMIFTDRQSFKEFTPITCQWRYWTNCLIAFYSNIKIWILCIYHNVKIAELFKQQSNSQTVYIYPWFIHGAAAGCWLLLAALVLFILEKAHVPTCWWLRRARGGTGPRPAGCHGHGTELGHAATCSAQHRQHTLPSSIQSSILAYFCLK